MRLCDHPEFEQAILAAAEHFKTRRHGSRYAPGLSSGIRLAS